NPYQPEIATGYFNPGATIDNAGTLTWCPNSLADTGIWNFAIYIVTYQKTYYAIGKGEYFVQAVDTVELELEVNINSVCYEPTINRKDTCVLAGDSVVLQYTAQIKNQAPLY